MTRNDFSPIVFSVVLFGAAIVVVAADDDESRRRRADDMMSTEMAALVQTHAQKIAQLEALVNAHQVQLGKFPIESESESILLLSESKGST